MTPVKGTPLETTVQGPVGTGESLARTRTMMVVPGSCMAVQESVPHWQPGMPPLWMTVQLPCGAVAFMS